MRVFRYGRVLDARTDALFQPQSGNAVALDRHATDNYIRPRTPNVDCTTTPPIPTSTSYDDGTQTNRWTTVAGKQLPEYVSGVGWKFSPNTAIRTSYDIPKSINNYSCRVVIPEPYFPKKVIPRQWCLAQVEQDDVVGKTISATGIRWGDVFWGVGHYRIRCCPNQQVEESACLVLDVGGNLECFFPLWDNVSVVELTIERLSSSLVRVVATGGGNTFAHTLSHTLTYNHPYRAEYYLYQLSQNCTAPEPTEHYEMQRMYAPSINYTWNAELPAEYYSPDVYVLVKTHPDPFTTPRILVELELEVDGEEFQTIGCEYNPDTNLWEPNRYFDRVPVRWWVNISTNQILDRVSVLVGGAVLHYVPAPHQREWLAVLPVEMEQTGIPTGIIPSGYDIIGVPDYTRWLSSGVLAVLPAQYHRILTIHLREKSV